MKLEHIARICHEANRAYCMTIGDDSQPAWEEIPEWQYGSAIDGIGAILHGEIKSPQDEHLRWLEHKQKDGWVFGPVKDPKKKTHPCMVPYNELPEEQRKKDAIFFAVVRACLT